MRKILFLIVLFAGVVVAQSVFQRLQYASNKTYAADQADTSRAFQLGSYSIVSLYYVTKDSAEADVYVDTKPTDGTSWTNAYADSVKTTSNTGTIQEIQIRNNTVERATGFGDYRVRTEFRSTGQGTSTAKYTAEIRYR